MKIFMAVLALALIGGVQPAQAQTTKLRLGWTSDNNGPGGAGLRLLAAEVKKRTNGAYEIELFGNGQIGNEVDLIGQVASGSLDMAMVGTGTLSTIEPNFAVVDLPFVWKSKDSYWKTVNGPIGQGLMDKLEGKGLKAIAWGSWGVRDFITNGFDVIKPEDMRGKRIRISQSPVFVKMIQAFGGNPAPLAWGEVYTGMQQKTIDGVESSPWAYLEIKLYEVATSVSTTEHLIQSAVTFMNLGKFKTLPPDVQKIFLEVGKMSGQAMYESINKANEDSIEQIKTKGVKIVKPDREAFRRLVGPVYELVTNKVGSDLLKQIQDAQK
ncbi:MAG TPA: TRAP transporter substrate-binding protein [Casimicrobiaceae bacterium]|nr:TRAP transporter substrate-binding protein [Candidatus Acidoferrum sp.]HXX84362.1 TRAP transporter substrate-binding protein [Casimicrobiaceae bacterium]